MNSLPILKVSTYEWYNFWGLDMDAVPHNGHKEQLTLNQLVKS